MSFQPERGAFSTPTGLLLKTKVLPQRGAFSADFAGMCSICGLLDAKPTESDRVVRPGVVLHCSFLKAQCCMAVKEPFCI